ncbi:hypothetical protein HK405_010105, partial [Cladochytrium tenue]
MDALPTLDSTRRAWRACLLCGLVKTRAQFLRDGCDNCDDVLELQGSAESVASCTSGDFQGIVALAQPSASWVGRWLRCDRFVKGVYAIRVVGRLPDEYVAALRDKDIVYRPRDGTSGAAGAGAAAS